MAITTYVGIFLPFLPLSASAELCFFLNDGKKYGVHQGTLPVLVGPKSLGDVVDAAGSHA